MALPFAELKAALQDAYDLQRELGQGGMGTVYLATDVRHERPVAVKILRPEVAAQVGPDRFLREVRLAAGLNHPRIVAVHDSGQRDGLLYYVMPYVDGETLGALLHREGGLPTGRALHVLTQVAEALSHAHSHGVIHRDLKPDNVLLSGSNALLADFGIAKALQSWASDKKSTAAGTVLGTPAYMAPEQVTGGDEVSTATDVYGFGILAYEVLAGAPPFSGEGAVAVLSAQLSRAPTPVESHRPDLPPALAALISRCLHKDPADRWESMQEIVARLEALHTSARQTLPVGAATLKPTLQHARIGEATCARLNLDELDPRLVGAKLQYLDNHAPSRELVVYLHGLGLDHREFEKILAESPFRGIAPTQAGFEPVARHRFELGIADHATILADFIADTAVRLQPDRLILAGFSSGADLAFRIVQLRRLPVDGLLSLDCNLNHDTCFVSRRLAALQSGANIAEELHRLGSITSNLSEWLNVHEYLVKVFRKFESNFEPLRRFAAEVSVPFEDDEYELFPGWYRDACARGVRVRCLFSRSSGALEGVGAIRRANLEQGVLGEGYREDSISIEDESDHFDLLQADRLNTHLAQLFRDRLS